MYYKDRNDYYIYKHTSPSNKVYIGYSCQKCPNYRWRNGNGYIKNPLIWNAIQKYGWENFKHEILKTGLTFEEANKWEIYYINLYKSNKRKYGYNLTDGGSNPNITETIKEKIRLAKLGKRFYRSTIYQYDNNGNLLNIFGSYRDAEEHTNINLYRIASACRNKGTAGNFCFSKISLNKDEVLYRFNKRFTAKYVYQYDLGSGILINRYNSNLDASIKTGLSEDTICISCSNNPKKDMGKAFPKGFLFRHDLLNSKELEYFITVYNNRNQEKILHRSNQYIKNEKSRSKNIKS